MQQVSHAVRPSLAVGKSSHSVIVIIRINVPTNIVYLNVNNTTSDRNNNRLSTKNKNKKTHVSTDTKIGETSQ